MSTTTEIKASEFLRALYGDWEQGYLVVWRSDDSASMCVVSDELEAVDRWVERNRAGNGADSYYGMGLHPKKMPSHERGKADDVIAIPGVWCDVDFSEGAKKKKSDKKYPPREVAEQCMTTMPLAPSVIVVTGGGIHPYWLFKEPFEISTDKDREIAANLVRGWQGMIAEHLRRLGNYEMDVTADLARVMRLPGSWNHRAGRPVLLHEDYANQEKWPRYIPSDLEPYLVDLPKPQKVVYEVGNLILDASRDIGAARMDALKDNCLEFWQCINHKGRAKYPSNSERELGIANYAAMAGWSDQEIADVLIYHRKRFEPEKIDKVLRYDYVAGTIAIARGEKNRAEAIKALAGMPVDDEPNVSGADQAAPVGTAERSESDREKDIEKISAVFGVKIDAWIQFGRERPIYSLVLTGGIQVKVGGVGAVLDSEKAIRQAIYARTGHAMKKVERGVWSKVAEALSRIVEVKEAGDATDKATVRESVRRYTKDRSIIKGKNGRMAAIANDDPFVDDGHVYVRPEEFFRWMNMHSGKKWEKGELLNVMEELGFVQCTPHYDRPETGTRTSKSYRRCDASILEDHPP